MFFFFFYIHPQYAIIYILNKRKKSRTNRIINNLIESFETRMKLNYYRYYTAMLPNIETVINTLLLGVCKNRIANKLKVTTTNDRVHIRNYYLYLISWRKKTSKIRCRIVHNISS